MNFGAFDHFQLKIYISVNVNQRRKLDSFEQGSFYFKQQQRNEREFLYTYCG